MPQTRFGLNQRILDKALQINVDTPDDPQMSTDLDSSPKRLVPNDCACGWYVIACALTRSTFLMSLRMRDGSLERNLPGELSRVITEVNLKRLVLDSPKSNDCDAWQVGRASAPSKSGSDQKSFYTPICSR